MHGMIAYFVRRILLVPLTFVCITFMIYAVMRLAPGGPIERAEMLARMAGAGEGGGGAGAGEIALPKEAIEELQSYYKLDKPIPVGYAIWLGVWPDGDKGFAGILQGEFGKSYRYSDPVFDTIVERFPISLYFGLIGYFAVYLICIPLGVYKALQHRKLFDTVTSMIVFLGYSVPGFVACLILMMLFATETLGAGWDVFPLGGFRSESWDAQWAAGEYWWCIKDQIHHTAIPVAGYLIGSFATMTILMKNSLLENLGADYVRTAFSKGLPERRVIFIHALRNSLIPICVGFGHALGLLIAGSFLIEKTCNIRGMGLLGFDSLIERDYPVLLGIAVIAVLSRLLGNIISDVTLAVVDPRVRFG